MTEKQCAHPSCGCAVPDGEKYCSPYCQDAAQISEIGCKCGHHGCAENIVTQSSLTTNGAS